MLTKLITKCHARAAICTKEYNLSTSSCNTVPAAVNYTAEKHLNETTAEALARLDKRDARLISDAHIQYAHETLYL